MFSPGPLTVRTAVAAQGDIRNLRMRHFSFLKQRCTSESHREISKFVHYMDTITFLYTLYKIVSGP